MSEARAQARRAAAAVLHATQRRTRKAGWDLVRYPAGIAAHRRGLLLRHLDVDLVIDVGANAGQYGGELREFGYTGRILSFEPLADAYRALQDAADADPAWEVRRTALGDGDGEATMHVAANSVSSSLLDMTARHTAADPRSAYVETQQVPLRRLDDELPADDARRPYLKIDTQGYELPVLLGAPTLLERVVGVELEMSLVAVYEGQALMPEMQAFMADRGFRLAGITTGFWDQQTGETLQVDATFVRAEV